MATPPFPSYILVLCRSLQRGGAFLKKMEKTGGTRRFLSKLQSQLIVGMEKDLRQGPDLLMLVPGGRVVHGGYPEARRGGGADGIQGVLANTTVSALVPPRRARAAS